MITGNYWSGTQQELVSPSDTTPVSFRNIISDVTFYDPNNIVKKIDLESCNGFPFLFMAKNREINGETKKSIIKHLKTGEELPLQPLPEDWVIGIILLIASLFAVVRITSRSLYPGVTRFFLFRGTSEPDPRNITGLFHWQSTILNLASFFAIALFCHAAASVNGIIPSGISGIVFWLIMLTIIIVAVTLRHFVCVITGNISGEKEAMYDYLNGIYQSYRFTALFLFIIAVLMNYTNIIPASNYIIPGIIVFGVMYLIRLLRLFIIFLNRNLSIFYLILYICALEFMPVLILAKYFSGLI
jgi:hypothetical protein